jgi:hypothetical protein
MHNSGVTLGGELLKTASGLGEIVHRLCICFTWALVHCDVIESVTRCYAVAKRVGKLDRRWSNYFEHRHGGFHRLAICRDAWAGWQRQSKKVKASVILAIL